MGNFFASLKIQTKLFLGFFLILALTVFIAVFGAIQIHNLNAEYTNAIDFVIERRGILRDIEITMMNARRTMNRASMHASDIAGDGFDSFANAEYRNIGITAQENLIKELRADLVVYFDAFRNNAMNDDRISQETIAQQLARLDALQDASLHYIDYYILEQIMTAARAGNTQATIDITTAAGGPGGTIPVINGLLEEMRAAIFQTRTNTTARLAQASTFTYTSMIVLAVAGAVIGLIIAYVISRMITKPVKEISSVISTVSKGDFNINFRHDLPTDEIGLMTKDIYSLVDVVKTMIADLTTAYNEYMTVGNSSYSIDNPIYQNSFAEAIGLVNHLLSQNAQDIASIADSLNQISEGDFSVNIDASAWPGDWKTMPVAINTLTDNLKGVRNEMNAMIVATAEKGDLNFRGDEHKYHGDWGKLIAGLNNIATAVDTPIQVIQLCLEQMRNGNFDLSTVDAAIRAKGFSPDANDYVGIFRTIISGVDDTADTISSYIVEITEDLAAISSGDLTTNLTREYLGSFAPIKTSLNHISVTLNKTMSEIFAASDQVLTGARQISESALSLANGASQQAVSIDQLNMSISLISDQTNQNASDSNTAHDLSNKSTAYAGDGNDAMKQMLEAMEGIKDSSNNISNIIKVIQEIAFQTNLLALNASVEAARAGEHGKGFAVVAEEVRSLAGRSQQAAEETTGLIEDSIGRVNTGSNVAETTATALTSIVNNAHDLLEIIERISSASKEQAEAVNNVSQNISQISAVIQSNSAVSEEAAASSQELSSQAEILKQLVSYFTI